MYTFIYSLTSLLSSRNKFVRDRTYLSRAPTALFQISILISGERLRGKRDKFLKRATASARCLQAQLITSLNVTLDLSIFYFTSFLYRAITTQLI